MHLIANLSLLFTEMPLARRFGAAAAAGFEGVEIQFPYESDPAALKRDAGGMPIVLINAPARDPRGANGLATDATQRQAFAENLEEAIRFAGILGVRKLNVLPGPPPPGQADAETEAVLADNLSLAAERCDGIGVAVVTEAINPFDAPGFWLDRLGKALSTLETLGDRRVKLQFDLYHMSRTEPDLVAAIGAAAPWIGHVQFADDPGRHEPGTGSIDFPAAFAALRRAGYGDAVSAEYRPAGRTQDGLGWMAAARGWIAG